MSTVKFFHHSSPRLSDLFHVYMTMCIRPCVHMHMSTCVRTHVCTLM